MRLKKMLILKLLIAISLLFGCSTVETGPSRSKMFSEVMRSWQGKAGEELVESREKGFPFLGPRLGLLEEEHRQGDGEEEAQVGGEVVRVHEGLTGPRTPRPRAEVEGNLPPAEGVQQSVGC